MVGDKEELPLKGMQVDVRVDGFRARVLVDLYYFNDRPQQLEGNFQLRLPDEASPYFFAFGRTVYQAPQVTAADSMFFKPQQVSQGDTTPEKILALRGNSWEQPKVARMVPKEKAALAYRDTVRRRIDPALVEWSGAGVFQCRVFPLAPQSLHRVTIGYDVDLVRVGDDLELRLDLPEQTPATIVDLNIAASDARQVSLDAPATTLTPGPSPDGRSRRARGDWPPPSREGSGSLSPDRSPGAAAGRAAAEAGHADARRQRRGDGQLFRHPRGPRPARDAGGRPAPSRPFSSSIRRSVPARSSRCGRSCSGPRWRTTATASRSSPCSSSTWRPSGGRRSSWPTRRRTSTALMNYADGLALEGATDLGRALKEAASPEWSEGGLSPPPDLFLLSDGAATWGEDRWPLLAATAPQAGQGRCRHRERARGAAALSLAPLPAGEGRRSARCSPIARAWPAAIRGCWPIWPSRRAGRSSRWWARRRSPRPRWPIAIGPGG